MEITAKKVKSFESFKNVKVGDIVIVAAARGYKTVNKGTANEHRVPTIRFQVGGHYRRDKKNMNIETQLAGLGNGEGFTFHWLNYDPSQLNLHQADKVIQVLRQKEVGDPLKLQGLAKAIFEGKKSVDKVFDPANGVEGEPFLINDILKYLNGYEGPYQELMIAIKETTTPDYSKQTPLNYVTHKGAPIYTTKFLAPLAEFNVVNHLERDEVSEASPQSRVAIDEEDLHEETLEEIDF